MPRAWPRCAALLGGLALGACVVPALAQTASATACPALEGAGVRQLVQADVTLAWKPSPNPIPLNQPFELELIVCGPAVQLVRVDADMPAHRHGMNYRTSISALDGQRSRAQGLVFHMPGRWRVMFHVQRGSDRLRLSDTVQVP